MSTSTLGSVAVRALLSAACGFVIIPALAGAQATGTALVRHAPSINGTVDGSVQQMLGEGTTLNGGARVTGDLFVPGTPNVALNGSVNYGGTLNGTGTATPTNYQVMLNGNVTLGHVVRRTNAVTLPTVAAPPNPAGTRNATINTAGQSPGSWATLKNLILNGNSGNYDVPAGTYGDFTVNGGSSITLGVPGATQAATYNFQALTLNGNAQFRVVGPVIVTVKNSVSANGTVGLASNPSWLMLRISSGGLTLNGTVSAYAHVAVPNGTVIINANTQLVGGVTCDRLTINGNGFLRLFPFQAANQPPVATAPLAALATNEDTVLAITLAGSDPENAPLTYNVVSSPIHGALTPPASGGAVRAYQPAANFSGSDSFTFKVNDGTLDSALVTVPITVLPINDPPEADPKSITTPEDTATSITLSGLDLETPAALTFTVTAQPAHGTLSPVVGGVVTYTPALDFHGPDSFAYVANDGALNSFPATVAITVDPRNDPPEAVARTITVEEEGEVTFALTGIDVDDPTGAGLTFEILDAPDHGARTGTVPDVTYAPDDNFAAMDVLTFRVYDGEAWSGPATITIVVTNLNDTPTANDQPVTVNEDADVAFVVTGADVDGDTITFSILTSPQNGTLAAGGVPITAFPFEGLVDGTLTYAPGGNYAGADQFIFRTRDGSAESAPATVSITVHPINDAPSANGQNVSTDEDHPAELTLTGDHIEGDTLQFIVTVDPQHGTLTPLVPGAAVFTYQPATNYFGADSFTFKARDGELDSAEIVIPITVNPINDAPEASPGAGETNEDIALDLALAGTDVDHAPEQLSFTIVTHPAFGTLAPAAGVGGFTYQPNPNYHGDDSFTFTVGDGEFTSPSATFALVVLPINDPPEVTNLSLETHRGQALPLTLNAIDVDGDGLTYAVGSPSNGALDPSSPGGPERTYTPAAGFAWADSFSFTVSDGTADPVAGTVAIQVINRAPTADNAPLRVTEDVAKSFTLTGSDPDGDALIYIIVDLPQHGTLSPIAPPSALSTFTYTPDRDFHGTDSLTFKVSDGSLESALATISITVDSVNDAPVAEADAFTTHEDESHVFALSGADVELSTLTFRVVDDPDHGFVTPPSGRGDFTYTPALNFHGADSFTFAANDGDLDSAPATVSITVDSVNDAPETADLGITTFVNQLAGFTLTGTDVDGDTLTFTVNAPQYGSITPASGGPTFTYAPRANVAGSDSATFTVSDGIAPPVAGTLAFTVLNRAPTAVDGAVTVTEDTPTPITLTATDPDGQPLTYTIVTYPQHGALSGIAPDLIYDPKTGFSGSDSFTFVAGDGTALSPSATIAINVVAENHPPTAETQSVGVTEDGAASITLSGGDPDNDAVTFHVVSSPLRGTLSGMAPNLVFTPSTDFNGNDSFSFRTGDGSAESAAALVSLTVVPVPDAPLIGLISPTAGASFEAPASIALVADAPDPDDDVIKVEFFANGSSIGETPSTPYVLSWDGVPSGTYTVSARATDATGLFTESLGVTVQVDANPLPTVFLTAPASGATVDPQPKIVLTASASTDLGVIALVEFYLGATKLGEDDTAPYEFAWVGALPGYYTLTARALSSTGATALSPAVIVTVAGNQIPTVSLLSPVDGTSVFTPSTVTIRARVRDEDTPVRRIEFYQNNTLLTTRTSTTWGADITVSVSWGVNAVGSYAIWARAYDSLGGFADSSVATIQATANQPPTVNLSVPSVDESYVAPASVSIQAAADDVDGTVAKVEFFADGNKLGEAAGPPYGIFWSDVPAGEYVLIARAIDNAGGTSVSTGRAIHVRSSVPQLIDFEVSEGFSVGALSTSGEWVANRPSVEITAATSVGGQQSVTVNADTTRGEATVQFAPRPSEQQVVFYDFWAKPAAGVDADGASAIQATGGGVALVGTGSRAEFQVAQNYDGFTSWSGTGLSTPLSVDSAARNWTRITLRQDYSTGRYDVFLDGSIALSDLMFAWWSDPRVTVVGHASAPTRLDNLLLSFDNPLFADADKDGLSDAWEVENGLDPTSNDRDLDLDLDGLTNIQENVFGSRPGHVDSDRDGLPDGWEFEHQLDPLNAASISQDADGDGVPDLVEYRLEWDPQEPDSDFDGIPDGQEDDDGDGFSTSEEILNQTDPNDYYNGLPPVLSSLVDADGKLGPNGAFALKVTRLDGTPLANAPVDISARGTNYQLAPSATSTDRSLVLNVRSDSSGVVRVYVRRTGE